jgi:hypothetical protein
LRYHHNLRFVKFSPKNPELTGLVKCSIAKIKKNHIWKEHKAAADEFERLQSRYDQIKQGTLDWMK